MSPELENLVRMGSLKREPKNDREIQGLMSSGEARLRDASVPGLSIEGRFDLAYNAAHALSLAALRAAGYRSENRFTVFEALQHTLKVEASVWRVLADCHGRRNRAEYEGVLHATDALVNELVAAAEDVLARLKARHPLTP